MAIAHYDRCFGCGEPNAAGLRIEAEVDGDGVSGRWLVEERQQGPPGYAHGGAVAAALDEVMSLAVQAAGAFALTARLEVDLRAPAPVRSMVALSARIVERGGGKLQVRSDARTSQDVIATANAVFVERPRPR